MKYMRFVQRSHCSQAVWHYCNLPQRYGFLFYFLSGELVLQFPIMCRQGQLGGIVLLYPVAFHPNLLFYLSEPMFLLIRMDFIYCLWKVEALGESAKGDIRAFHNIRMQYQLLVLSIPLQYLWWQVGHAGTLDPMATGLLIVCVGKATKIVDR